VDVDALLVVACGAHRVELIGECGCCSRGYATHSGTDEDTEEDNSDAIETSQPLPTRKGGGPPP
jgi:hypothetical protein